MNRWDVINAAADVIGARTYLEIGVRWGCNIQRVRIKSKVGVDPDPQVPPSIDTGAAHVQMTSDEFFLSDNHSHEKFDVIFIDGLHFAEQVELDVVNALCRLAHGGIIIIHDCSPPTEQSAKREILSTGSWCGDVWKAWVKLRQILDREMFVVDEDLGCGVILDAPSTPMPPIDVPIEWANLERNRQAWLNLHPWRWYTHRLRQLRGTHNRV